ncbi:RNA polymerase sigma factor [Halalkalibacter alkalisediminis]|uniref:RNA polymerase sigma factor n=1 Tax=Halalkalibacter alkalisediminis TaxID=935616 RepID=A0ABV6NLZ1_9BACI|nr:RNA polymerase sigma factor [Halalkalibacter alkalisediminis]
MDDTEFQIHLNKQLKLIFHYLIKQGASRQDAEDIVQDAALILIENIDAISPEKVQSWLFRVSLNRYYDLLRRNKVKHRASLELQLFEKIKQGLMPEEVLVQKEISEEVINALEKMPKRYKEFLILKYIFDLRYKDIGKIAELNTGTVKTVIFRAKKVFIDIYREVQNEQG